MDRRPNCNRGQIVPIFANNKKKRLRQALYASPTKAEQTEDLEDLSIVTSLNSHNEWNDGDDCFETNDTGSQKQSFPRPQKSNSVIKVGNINDSLPSVCISSRQSRSFNDLDCIGNIYRKGLRQPVKQESQLHHNYSVDSARPNFTSFDYNDVRFATNSATYSFFFSYFKDG
ncbi:uncharacterized protein LOC110054613 [Orbicella faveolata]|uniref:uncharacterized protein LOC110054613 n=1 Tax=Orbicella faveolata TaxID=48498 RepID=UPI0009E56319|nr:uncharacterized protein LOC110054613 [Orbicella faveolata]